MAKIFRILAATLNAMGRDYADSLIAAGKVDKSSAWSFSADDGNALLGPNGDDWDNYGKHHLGVDASAARESKAHWKYPFAKGGTLYRSGLTAIRSRAAAENDTEIYDAAGAMLEKLDGEKPGDLLPARAPHDRQLRDFARDPLNYRVAAKGDVGEVYLYDSIGAFFGISAKQFTDDLKALGSVKTINLRVNSDGGDVFDGRAIFTQLAQHPARIVAHVDGIAASIASLIVMAADEIRMAEGAFLMIHNAWGITIGNADEMRRYAMLLDSVDQTIVDTYVKRTKNSADDVRAWMAAETWMDGEDAVAKGFADVLDEPAKVAASLRRPDSFRNVPAALRSNRAAALATIERMKFADRRSPARG